MKLKAMPGNERCEIDAKNIVLKARNWADVPQNIIDVWFKNVNVWSLKSLCHLYTVGNTVNMSSGKENENSVMFVSSAGTSVFSAEYVKPFMLKSSKYFVAGNGKPLIIKNKNYIVLVGPINTNDN